MLNNLNKLRKNEYFVSRFEAYKGNLKMTWKLIGNLISRKTKGQAFPTRLDYNGNIYTSENDISDQFNTYFSNVGPDLASRIIETEGDVTNFIGNSPSTSCFLAEVELHDVIKHLQSLDSNKASLDIPNKFIKIASNELAVPLTHIFNKSIRTGIVPDLFKISRITPIQQW